jgi:hypothetical protein
VKNNIYVQDNFFEKEFFKKLQAEVMSMEFRSRYNDFSKELKKDNVMNNIYQRNFHHVVLSSNTPVVKEVVNNIRKYFHHNPKKMVSWYFLSFPNTPPIPHNDVSQFNCLIYLIGDKLVNNGTGFYEKLNDEYQLHTHIGFKENRAIFFDSKIFHSPLQWAGNATPRYVMANFLDA